MDKEEPPEKNLPRGAPQAAPRRIHSAPARKPQADGPSEDGERQYVACQIHNGLATVAGKTRGHYVSRQGGRRMLVLECGQGGRIRINDTTEIVVLEISPGEVKIAVEPSPDGALWHRD